MNIIQFFFDINELKKCFFQNRRLEKQQFLQIWNQPKNLKLKGSFKADYKIFKFRLVYDFFVYFR